MSLDLESPEFTRWLSIKISQEIAAQIKAARHQHSVELHRVRNEMADHIRSLERRIAAIIAEFRQADTEPHPMPEEPSA